SATVSSKIRRARNSRVGQLRNHRRKSQSMLDKRIQSDDTPNNRCAWLCLGLIFLLLAACTPAATYQASAIQAQGVFSASGETPLPVHWWTNFEHPALDRLIAQALADNFTLLGSNRKQ
ncbi:MAG: hypothetical protein R6X34_20240, partial [Chloroflexota bacterium]